MKKRAHCGDRTLDRTLDKRPDAATGCWVETRQTGDRTRGPDAGGNRPDVGTQRPIEYSKVLERHICDRTRPVAGDRTLASVQSVHCRLNGRDDRTRPCKENGPLAHLLWILVFDDQHNQIGLMNLQVFVW